MMLVKSALNPVVVYVVFVQKMAWVKGRTVGCGDEEAVSLEVEDVVVVVLIAVDRVV